jgi:hypothetical protein
MKVEEYKNENGELHRTDGPALITQYGEYWYINGVKHRTDGPASIERNRDRKYWYKHGKLHRLDGPAIEYENGISEYWLDGIRYSKEEYKEVLRKYLNVISTFISKN